MTAVKFSPDDTQAECLPPWRVAKAAAFAAVGRFYEVFRWRTPIMLTTNVWSYAGYSEPDKNWIESNCVAVHISQPVWHSGDTPPSSPRVAARLPLQESMDMSDVSPARSEL